VALRVEVRYVGDRLAGARLAQAYGFCVPERLRVTAKTTEEVAGDGGFEAEPGEDRRDLRPGLNGSSARAGDERKPGRRAA
jgi:hypothetical protein